MALKSLKNRITITFGGIIVVVGGLTAFGIGYYTKNVTVDQKKNEIMMSTTNTADSMENFITTSKISGENIAKNKTVKAYLNNNEENLGGVDMERFLTALNLDGNYNTISILNIDRRVLASTDKNSVGNEFAYRKYLEDSSSKKWGVEFAVNDVTKEPQFFFANLIENNDGSRLGFVVMTIDSEVAFNKLFGNNSYMTSHTHMLLDGNGVVIESNEKDRVYKSIGNLSYESVVDIKRDAQYNNVLIEPLQYDSVAKNLKNLKGISLFNFTDKKNGGNELLSISPIKSYPFFVAMELRETDYMGSSAKLYYGLGIFIFTAALFAALMIYIFVGKFLKPLRQLRTAAERISNNDFDFAVSIESGDDLEELGGAFNRMIAGIKKSIAEIDEKVKLQTKDILKKQFEIENQKKAAFNILEDMAEEKETSEKLAIDLEKFKLAIENANDQIAITDENGVIIYSNPAMTRITGYTQAEAVGKTPSLWGKQMGQQYYAAFWKTIKEKKLAYDGELYNIRKDGTKFLAHLHVSPILDKKGDVRFFVGILRDISKERQAQIQLRQDAEDLKKANVLIENQKERAESILTYLKSIGDGVVATDLEGRIIFFNEASEKLTGVFGSDAVGKKSNEILMILEEKNSSVQHDVIQNVLEGKHDFDSSKEHFLIKSREGLFVAVSFTASVIYDKNNKKQGCILVMRDVTEQREIEKTKDDFLSVAAHQLRTPLTGIRWSLEMLLDGDLGKLTGDAEKALDKILENNQRLILLVNDLLDVSRINMGKSTEEASSVGAIHSLQEAIDALSGLAGERGVKISMKKPAVSEVNVKIGPKHFFQALENLISNAIKYTPKDGIVEAAVQVKKDKVIISIRDTGIGIPQKEQKNIFSKFFRAGNAVKKETEGSGLGLNVVKSFIEEAGGKVWFESQEGEGTTFFIELPVV